MSKLDNPNTDGRKGEMSHVDETFEEACIRFERDRWAQIAADLLFNDAAMDRIVAAVGKEPSGGRPALSAQLGHLERKYSIWHGANDQPGDGEIHDELVALVSELRKARKILAGPNREYLIKLAINAVRERHNETRVRHVIDGLQDAEAAFGSLLQKESYDLGLSSAKNWAICEAFPRVYKQQFGDEVGMARDKQTKKPNSPGIRFIVEVLSIMGVLNRDGKPFEATAIEYYIKQSRRQSRHDGLENPLRKNRASPTLQAS
jgi:hypothetical protein